MKIEAIFIDAEIQRKIYEKHNILAVEIKRVLKENKPIFRKVGSNQVMAVGLYNRYITIFFRYDKKTKSADIRTAYPSGKKQIKYYKKLSR